MRLCPPIVPFNILREVLSIEPVLSPNLFTFADQSPQDTFLRSIEGTRKQVLHRLTHQGQLLTGQVINLLPFNPGSDAIIISLGYSTLVDRCVEALFQEATNNIPIQIVMARGHVEGLAEVKQTRDCFWHYQSTSVKNHIQYRDTTFARLPSLFADLTYNSSTTVIVLVGAAAAYPIGAACERGTMEALSLLRAQFSGATTLHAGLVVGRYKYVRNYNEYLIESIRQSRYHEHVEKREFDSIITL